MSMKTIRILIILGILTHFSLQASESWFVSAQNLPEVRDPSLTRIIDARPISEYKKGHLPGAVSANWEDFSEPNIPKKGNLLPYPKLVERIQALGITAHTAVYVYGDPIRGWGEEGRIAWMLRSLGHNKTYIVDGGFPALKASGKGETQEPTAPPTPSNYRPSPPLQFSTQKEEIRANLGKPSWVFLDTREDREFQGGVPYGEARGGRLPGAKHIHYRSFLDAGGFLLPKDKIQSILSSKGIDPKSTVVSYCTGGVRSGWVTAVLSSYGYQVKNYPGSMWEWSHLPAKQYPLEIGVAQ